MSFGVDTLGGLIEKLKTLVNDTQNNYESFFDSTQLFKQGKMDSNEYFSRMGEFLVSSSALNFLSCRVILELKSAMDKNISAKGKNERSPSSTMPSGSGGNISGSAAFGNQEFIRVSQFNKGSTAGAGSGQGHSHNMSATFSGDATSVLQPYLTIIYIIKT